MIKRNNNYKKPDMTLVKSELVSVLKASLAMVVLTQLTACQKPEPTVTAEITQEETVSKKADTNNQQDLSELNRDEQLARLAGVSHQQLIEFDPQEIRQGGESGISISSRESYSKPSSNLKASRKGNFFIGNAFFKQPWVVAPASTDARDGLGGLFNVAACQSCHIKDGRGHAPIDENDNADSLLIRLSMPATTAEQKRQLASSEIEKVPHPVYGGQLQDRGIQDVPAEGRVKVTWSDQAVTFKDGYRVTLRRPNYTIVDSGYGKFDDELMLSPRVSLPMIGLGLLEQIADDDIKKQADVDDKNTDGISGKFNWVHNSRTGKLDLGRFGWKAGQPELITQNQAAFNGDLGLTSRLNPEENCMPKQTACINAPSGADDQQDGKKPVEISDDIAEFVDFYTRNLAVPNRRNAQDPKVIAGKQRFYDMGCVSCHTPRYQLPKTDDDRLEQHGQIIYPYTDMLLHDMGDDLADRTFSGKIPDKHIQVEFLANSHEWRTQPLWGIGLAQKVDAQATFLHDGRARTPMEAVLWHGGEAEQAKNKVLKLDKQGREELKSFLNSL